MAIDLQPLIIGGLFLCFGAQVHGNDELTTEPVTSHRSVENQVSHTMSSPTQAGRMTTGLFLLSWAAIETTFAQNTTASPNNRCLPGNTNNNNLNLSGLNGTFESPRDPYHSQYYPGMSCDWLITVPEGNIVKLSFELFDMESVGAGFPLWRCYGDYVEVLEGNRSDSKAKGKLCGESNPGIIRSRSRYMLVRFRSDSSHSSYRYHKGFKADFTAENKLICPYYGEALAASISDKKTLTSPGYPLLPPASLLPWRCRWILKLPDDLSTGGAYVLKVTFNHFNLQKASDRLTFYDGINSASTRLGKSYSGTVHPDVIYSTGRHMFVDFSVEGKWYLEAGSFSLNFSAVVREEAFGACQLLEGNTERSNLTGSSGTLFSPFYPTPYSKNVICIWVISVPANKRVKLTFDKFDLAPGEDNVRILDGRESSSEEVAVYHGYNLFSSESAVYSTGGYMWIKFQSTLDSWYHTGFKAHFEAVEPPKTKAVNSSELCYPDNVHNFDLRLTGSEGILESPLTYYPPGLFCEWLITVPEGQSVELIFERFQLDHGCRDYVEVGDGMPLSGTSLGKYCGTTIPENVRSSHRNRYMWVEFYSATDYAGRKPHRGFKATFKAVSSSESPAWMTPIIVTVIVFIALIVLSVCLAERVRRRNREAAERFPMAIVSRRTPSEPVSTNADIPPPDYPYPLESPPPYPGEEQIPQFPPPGQSYPWQQSTPAEESVTHENS
nr:cubilin-like [Pocillopora verrucosa]